MNENLEPNFTEGSNETVGTPNPAPMFVDRKENVLAGIVGAFLFSLAGGVIWFLLYQVGFIASISGVVGVICAIKGYSVFAKGESVKGVIISSVIAYLVIVIAWYLCLSYDVYVAYGEWFAAGEIDFELTFFESVRSAYLFLSEPDVGIYYWKDLGIGTLFCVAACISTVVNAVKKVKAGKMLGA